MISAGAVDFGAVFAAAPTPYLVLNTDLVIVAVNDAYLEAATRTRSDLLARHVFDAFPDNPEDPDALATTNLGASLRRVLRTARPDTMATQKYDVPTPDGSFLRRWWSPINTPVLDGDGQVVWVLHRVEDVTDYLDQQPEAGPHGSTVAGAGSALRTARADLHRAESDLFSRGRELREALTAEAETSRRLVSVAQAARRAAEQQAALVDVAREMGEAEDQDAVLAVIARHNTRLLDAAGSGLCLRDPGSTSVRIAMTDTIADAVRQAMVTMPLDTPLPIVDTAATGVAHFHEDLAVTLVTFPAADELYTASGTQAAAHVPLRAHGRLLGSLSMAFSRARDWPEQDRDLVTAFAALTAQALDRIGARDAERAAREAERAAGAAAARFSETLQHSMLTTPVQPDHLQIAVRYSPAVADAQVGGDWYDAFLTPGGVTNLVVGDVGGHDQAAAAVMGQLRHLVRGIAHATSGPPADVLRSLDHAAHDLGVDGIATLVLAQVEQPPERQRDGTRLLRWSNAGHPPPLLFAPGQAPRFLEAGSDLVVGIDPRTTRHDHTTVLEPGATVLLYTDGLVERRGASLDHGLEWLLGAVRTLEHHSLEDLCDRLLELVGGQVEDDVALLALRAHPQDAPRPPAAGSVEDPLHAPPVAEAAAGLEGLADARRSAVLLLDPEPAAVGRARNFVHEYCCRLPECGDICDTLTLLVSEVVTNAFLHGRSQTRLVVEASQTAVRVEVSDDNSRHPVLTSSDPDALDGRGLAMVDMLATAWGVRDEEVGKTVWIELHAT